MTTLSMRLTVIFSALLLLASCGHDSGNSGLPASTKQDCSGPKIVDDFQLAQGASSLARAATKDKSGNVYVAGTGYDLQPDGHGNGPGHGVVRMSSDGGKTWKTLDDYKGEKGGGADYTSIATDSKGRILAGVVETESRTSRKAGVRVSADHGKTWKYQAFDLPKDPVTRVTAAEVSPSDVPLYAVDGVDKQGFATWYVVKDLKPVDTFGPGNDPRFRSATPRAIAFGPDKTIYVAGEADDINGYTHWVVRMSRDDGKNWAEADNFQVGFNPTMATSIMVTDDGTIYAAGRTVDYSGNWWLIRRSEDGGVNWETVNDYRLAEHRDASGNFLLSVNGLPLSLGYTVDAKSVVHGTARAGLNGGSKWITADDFQYGPDHETRAIAGVVGTHGDIFIIGQGLDDAAKTHWLVRRLSACALQ